jgi:hypothetical protein
MNVILQTALISLFIQIIIAIIGIIGIQLPLTPKYVILRELLTMETIVQIIELIYYVWLIYNFSTIHYDVTYTRYFDWILSTPIMIISTVLYMKYRTTPSETPIRLAPLFMENIHSIWNILLFNWVMLLFGFLGERKWLSRINGFLWGTIAFCISFFLIYANFVGNDIINQYLFWFMFVFWGMYGVAYCFSYATKNSMYNILDIFSKNFYGLFLSYEVWNAYQNSKN